MESSTNPSGSASGNEVHMDNMDQNLDGDEGNEVHISEIVSPPPPYQTALSLMDQRVRNEYLAGHLPTCLKGLDEALCGGIPSAVLTELVGPAGIGKTQDDRNWSKQFSRNISHGRNGAKDGW